MEVLFWMQTQGTKKKKKYTRTEAGLAVAPQQTLVRDCACSSWFTETCGDQIKPNYALLM